MVRDYKQYYMYQYLNLIIKGVLIMSNVHDISGRYKKRFYKTSHCAGCTKEIMHNELFTTVVLPSGSDEEEETHIALCEKCNKAAEEEGIF